MFRSSVLFVACAGLPLIVALVKVGAIPHASALAPVMIEFVAPPVMIGRIVGAVAALGLYAQ
jgi:hypothetical protein